MVFLRLGRYLVWSDLRDREWEEGCIRASHGWFESSRRRRLWCRVRERPCWEQVGEERARKGSWDYSSHQGRVVIEVKSAENTMSDLRIARKRNRSLFEDRNRQDGGVEQATIHHRVFKHQKSPQSRQEGIRFLLACQEKGSLQGWLPPRSAHYLCQSLNLTLWTLLTSFVLVWDLVNAR